MNRAGYIAQFMPQNRGNVTAPRRPEQGRGCQRCRAYGPPRVSLAACIPAYPAGNADGRSRQARADLPLAPLPPGRHGLALPRPAATAPTTSTTATGRRRSRRPRCIRRSSLRSSPAFTRSPLRIPPASPWDIRDGLLSEPLAFPTALAVRTCRRLAPRPATARSFRFAEHTRL